MSPQDSLRDSICNNAALRRATRRLGQLYDDRLAGAGLKATQTTLLSQVHILNEPTLKELANELVMDLSALSHTLKPLVRDGLVKIVPDKRDARAKRVTLTPAGRAKLEVVMELWTEVHKRFEEVLGPEQAQKLRATLDLIASPDFAEAFGEGRPVAEPSE
jgi:DNA-binding MarR family transcriptional regulator